MAEILHYKYEHFARVVGWKTQGVCRVDFNKLPKRNKSVMIFMAKFVLKEKALSEKLGRRKENRYIIDMVLSIATSWVTTKDGITNVLNYDNFVDDVEQLRDNLEKDSDEQG